MGLFQGPTAAYFKRDATGRELFFIWGNFGKGRVIPSEADGDFARRYMTGYFFGTLAIIIPAIVLLPDQMLDSHWLLVVGLLLVLAWTAMLPLHLRTRQWPLADETMTYRESLTITAKAYGSKMMLIFVIVIALGLVASILLLLFTTETLAAAIVALGSGILLVIFMFMLRASRRG
jgi:hypothetical protein